MAKRSQREAGVKAARTRKRRAAGRKAARTRSLRARGRRAATTRRTRRERVVKLPPEARRGAHLKTGKGWRLVTANRTRAHKAALLKTFRSAGQRFAIFRIAR
ncbi:MAG: hypothetical protein ACRD09_14490 [Vicinamibacterales bacterium]